MCNFVLGTILGKGFKTYDHLTVHSMQNLEKL